MIARTFGIVDAQHRDAVERQALHEIEKRLAQPPEVVAVGFHVVGVDVGDHREHRLQIQERRVRLVGLDHDEFAAARASRASRPPPAGRRSRRSDPCRLRRARSRPGWWWWSCRACRRPRCPAASASARRASSRAARPGCVRARAARTSGLSGLHRGRDDDRVGAVHLRRVVAADHAARRVPAGARSPRSRPDRSRSPDSPG